MSRTAATLRTAGCTSRRPRSTINRSLVPVRVPARSVGVHNRDGAAVPNTATSVTARTSTSAPRSTTVAPDGQLHGMPRRSVCLHTVTRGAEPLISWCAAATVGLPTCPARSHDEQGLRPPPMAATRCSSAARYRGCRNGPTVLAQPGAAVHATGGVDRTGHQPLQVQSAEFSADGCRARQMGRGYPERPRQRGKTASQRRLPG